MHSEKEISSGRLLEIEYDPCFSDGRALPYRSKKEKLSTAAQAAYNRKNAEKKLTRLINCNFDGSDYWMTLTYRTADAPEDEAEAKKDLNNYIRRLKRAREKKVRELQGAVRDKEKLIREFREKYGEANLPDRQAGGEKIKRKKTERIVEAIKKERRELREKIRKLSSPLRYIYVIESKTYRRGVFTGKTNYHFHMVISGGLSREDMERCWVKGARVSCDAFMPERFGAESAAKYMSKDPQGGKSFCCSKNLKKPKVKKREKIYTSSFVDRMCKTRIDDKEYWERRYRGYRFSYARALFNEYNGQMYFNAVMFRSDTAPPAEWGCAEVTCLPAGREVKGKK